MENKIEIPLHVERLIQEVEIEKIVAYEKNARCHPKAQIKLLKDSITKFGLVNLVVVDEDFIVLTGHGRLIALKELGHKQIKVVVLKRISETQKIELRLADNKIAEKSHWDEALLAQNFQDLKGEDFSSLATGFTNIEIEKLLSIDFVDISDSDDGTDKLTDSPAISKSGDVWNLAESKILCGNALEETSYKCLLGDELADAIITDPPYNQSNKTHVGSKGRHKHDEFAMASGEMSDTAFSQFLSDFLAQISTRCKNGALTYVFADWRMLGKLLSSASAFYQKVINVCVWVKPNAGMGSFYRSQHEFVVIFKKGSSPHTNNVQLGRMGRNRSNIWQYEGMSGFSKNRDKNLADHPTVKPLKMIADAIRDCTNVGDLILDPFGGSGTTLLAAHSVQRRAALIEIDPKYVDVTIRRFVEQTGMQPTLATTGQTFEEVKAERLAN